MSATSVFGSTTVGYSDAHKKNEAKDVKIQVHPKTNHATEAWADMCRDPNRIHKKLPIPKPSEHPKPAGFVRFVCISDTHSKLAAIQDKLPPGDVLIHAGDFTRAGRLQEIAEFNEIMGRLNYRHKIVIAGNHELSFDRTNKKRSFVSIMNDAKSELKQLNLKDPRQLLTNCTYLEDSSIRLYGYNIYGSPHQPEYFGWAFNVPRGKPLLDLWNRIPSNTDILITHGPPVGYNDRAIAGVNAGCVELLSTIERRVHPLYHIFGHIHEAYGMSTNGETVFINAATCDVSYRALHEPVIFDLPVKPETALQS